MRLLPGSRERNKTETNRTSATSVPGPGHGLEPPQAPLLPSPAWTSSSGGGGGLPPSAGHSPRPQAPGLRVRAGLAIAAGVSEVGLSV